MSYVSFFGSLFTIIIVFCWNFGKRQTTWKHTYVFLIFTITQSINKKYSLLWIKTRRIWYSLFKQISNWSRRISVCTLTKFQVLNYGLISTSLELLPDSTFLLSRISDWMVRISFSTLIALDKYLTSFKRKGKIILKIDSNFFQTTLFFGPIPD